MRTSFLAAATAALTLAACAPGCGPGEGSVSATVPVKGKISYQGKPLTRGEIRFEPEDIGREASGTIAADGTFVMSTFKPKDGAILGTHRVTATGADIPATVSKASPRSRGGAKTSPSQPRAVVEITADKADYEIDLK
jgi:hypothetical protein